MTDSIPWRVRTTMYTRTFRRSLRRNGLHILGAIGPLEPDWVFVLGCPRSGTTFTAESLGTITGFRDLGEVNRFKQAIPGLYEHPGDQHAVTKKVRGILRRSQRAAMASHLRPIEQTPESVFLIEPLAHAFPRAVFVHLLRDGRDVAASLLEKGWLSDTGTDDAGIPYGGYARFWVEPDRREEFSAASQATRAAWAWRRYVSAAQAQLHHLRGRSVTIRYETLARDPDSTAALLADTLGISDPATVRTAIAGIHPRSIGRYRAALTAQQLSDVEAEAGPLLLHCGYASDGPHEDDDRLVG